MAGVECVQDELGAVEAPQEPVFYTVVSGNELIHIAKVQYGYASKYIKIYDANQPMLSHPNNIYSGQSLRIPA